MTTEELINTIAKGFAGQDKEKEWNRCIRDAKDALLAIEFMKLKILEKMPTSEMIESAGGEEVDLYYADNPSYEPKDIWETMYDAAPTHFYAF